MNRSQPIANMANPSPGAQDPRPQTPDPRPSSSSTSSGQLAGFRENTTPFLMAKTAGKLRIFQGKMSRKCSKVAKSLIRLGKMVVEEVGWTWMTFHNFIKLYTTATTTMKKKPPDNGQMSGWKMVGKLGGKLGGLGSPFLALARFRFRLVCVAYTWA